jgi:hypothetical protein
MISLLVGAGVAGWIYFKVMERTGGTDVKSSLILVGFAGLFVAMAFYAFLTLALG